MGCGCGKNKPALRKITKEEEASIRRRQALMEARKQKKIFI
jgi:hypothetical protein